MSIPPNSQEVIGNSKEYFIPLIVLVWAIVYNFVRHWVEIYLLLRNRWDRRGGDVPSAANRIWRSERPRAV